MKRLGVQRILLSIPVFFALLAQPACCNRGSTITGPNEIIIVVPVPTIGRAVANFVFTQDLGSDDVSLEIQNVSQRVASFNYTINFSVSGQGWTHQGAVSMLEVASNSDEGVVAFDSPTLTLRGFIIVISSIVLDGVAFSVEEGELVPVTNASINKTGGRDEES